MKNKTFCCCCFEKQNIDGAFSLFLRQCPPFQGLTHFHSVGQTEKRTNGQRGTKSERTHQEKSRNVIFYKIVGYKYKCHSDVG